MKYRGWIGMATSGAMLLLVTGCGELFKESVKQGVYTFISGSLSAGQLASQIGDLILGFVPPGTLP